MPLGVVVTARAKRQIEEAATWWEFNRPLAPGAVHDELSRAFELLRTHSGIGHKVLGAKTVGVRCFELSRIHYYVYYRVWRGNVHVLAFWHTSRGSGPRV